MPRAKKDGKFINYYVDRQLCEKLEAYAENKGQTITMALERILRDFFDKYEPDSPNNNAEKLEE